jgi:competence protein ComFC
MPIKIQSPWTGGWALAWHTISSTSRPDGSFDTVRTDLGEALYQLKYHSRLEYVEPLAEIAAEFIRRLWVLPRLRALVPVPPSVRNRALQPVLEVVQAIGARTGLPVAQDYVLKVKQTPPLKNIDDAVVRHEQLAGAFRVADERYAGQSILLFDDLYRSGETLAEVCRTLAREGSVGRIYVLTLTRTRSRR